MSVSLLAQLSSALDKNRFQNMEDTSQQNYDLRDQQVAISTGEDGSDEPGISSLHIRQWPSICSIGYMVYRIHLLI